MIATYPRWIWADTNALRVELTDNEFVDYVRDIAGVSHQKTAPMTDKESVYPERHWLNDWRTKVSEWPAVDAELGVWLETTLEGIGR